MAFLGEHALHAAHDLGGASGGHGITKGLAMAEGHELRSCSVLLSRDGERRATAGVVAIEAHENHIKKWNEGPREPHSRRINYR
jgi:hypothetical protein